MPSTRLSTIVALCLASLLAGCVSRSGARGVEGSPPSPPTVAGQPLPVVIPDPATALIAEADRHFATGQRELALGHLERAREEFDGALDVLLESPEGVRANARLREHFDRLVDRISALEAAAFAAGDGFTEARSEPASIDTLVEIGGLDTAPPQPATAETVEADLESTAHDIPIPVNNRVLRYVELFQGRLREFLAEGLTRSAQYLPMIQSVFRSEGLPLDLAYVPLVESAFKPTALSRAKARGVWQFMKGTALENGLKSDWYLDERADPEKATQAAARYLKSLYDVFQDWPLALASYNGGPGRVQRAMTRSRKNDFWALSTSSRYLPRETREYVPMILAAVIIARNPAQYGFNVLPTDAPTVERVTVPHALDLRRVAEWAGASVDEIQALNPEFRRWTTPIREGEYQLRVPAGTADRVREGLAAAAPHQMNALQWHTVKKGETLLSIAKKLRVSRADLAEANYLKPAARVTPGQRLVVPRMPSAALLARAASADAPEEAQDVLKDTVAVGQPESTVYRVRAGDTLYAIARRNGVTVEQLKAWNNLRSSRLQIGDRLIVQQQ
jgi:membrane-bound lytic murein transglycosylase D